MRGAALKRLDSEDLFEPGAQSPRVESLSDYLAALASEHPTPGGGSAATIVAAAGAALVAMVARICAKSPKYEAQRLLALELVDRADALRRELEGARIRDEAAFAGVVDAGALPKSTDDEKRIRRASLERALAAAAFEPLRSAGFCVDVLRVTQRLLEIPNKHLASDVGCAAEFASAGLAACAYNVRINHAFMHDAQAVAKQEAELALYERESLTLLSAIRQSLR